VSATAQASPGALARTNDLGRTFGPFTAVDGVSLHVDHGEIVGLLGANGAGKTTVIRLLLGILAPTTGSVALFGEPPSRRTRARLGYVPQGLGIYEDLTVRENLEFCAAAYGLSTTAFKLPAPLEDVTGRLAGEIGLGRQRQLAFACALGHAPELLILDEPTSGVDPLARAELWDQVRGEAERGVGVMVTTHYLEEAQQCDRLIIMAAGRIVLSGTLEEVIGDATAILVRADAWASAFQALVDAGAVVVLKGRDARVANACVEDVRHVLDVAGISADLEVVPATLEETMATIAE
jgi:ABC-2 type transport system ATP-binding protein